jgi:hypothetical protein
MGFDWSQYLDLAVELLNQVTTQVPLSRRLRRPLKKGGSLQSQSHRAPAGGRQSPCTPS